MQTTPPSDSPHRGYVPDPWQAGHFGGEKLMKASLVILAAGLGRRYGGLKQVEPVGPHGETIIDYNAYDALRAGFGKIVFVVRREMATEFRAAIGNRLEQVVAVEYAIQDADAQRPGFPTAPAREKPWGTGQAVLAAKDAVTEPFAVANADDFYGSQAIAAMGSFLQAPHAETTPAYAMIGYRLLATLPEAGAVSRAVCHGTADGWLETIEEIVGLERHDEDARCIDKSGQARIINGQELVSMNLWGL